jgi:hypothetical protein
MGVLSCAAPRGDVPISCPVAGVTTDAGPPSRPLVFCATEASASCATSSLNQI